MPEQYRNRHSEYIRENADALLSAICGDDSNRNHQDQRGFAWERDARGVYPELETPPERSVLRRAQVLAFFQLDQFALELADILGYSDAYELTKRLDDDEKSNRQIVGFEPQDCPGA